MLRLATRQAGRWVLGPKPPFKPPTLRQGAFQGRTFVTKVPGQPGLPSEQTVQKLPPPPKNPGGVSQIVVRLQPSKFDYFLKLAGLVTPFLAAGGYSFFTSADENSERINE